MEDRMREKLIELIARFCGGLTINDITPPYGFENLADHLIANGVTIQKWIPVTERLPEDRQRVLGWCGCDRIYHNILHFANCLENISCDFEGSKYSGFYDYDSEWGYYEVTDITHWMPLPEAPKGE